MNPLLLVLTRINKYWYIIAIVWIYTLIALYSYMADSRTEAVEAVHAEYAAKVQEATLGYIEELKLAGNRSNEAVSKLSAEIRNIDLASQKIRVVTKEIKVANNSECKPTQEFINLWRQLNEAANKPVTN